MNTAILRFAVAVLLLGFSGLLMACEYTEGKDKYVDYAICRYGEEAIIVVDLPEGSSWEQCVYYAEAFRPPKLLAVTKDVGGKEDASIGNRQQIGNPCYLTKAQCDKAYKAQQG